MGSVEKEGGVLVLKRIHVRYELRTTADVETVERVHEMHHEHCPVYRSIDRAIEVTTSLEIVRE